MAWLSNTSSKTLTTYGRKKVDTKVSTSVFLSSNNTNRNLDDDDNPFYSSTTSNAVSNYKSVSSPLQDLSELSLTKRKEREEINLQSVARKNIRSSPNLLGVGNENTPNTMSLTVDTSASVLKVVPPSSKSSARSKKSTKIKNTIEMGHKIDVDFLWNNLTNSSKSLQIGFVGLVLVIPAWPELEVKRLVLWLEDIGFSESYMHDQRVYTIGNNMTPCLRRYLTEIRAKEAIVKQERSADDLVLEMEMAADHSSSSSSRTTTRTSSPSTLSSSSSLASFGSSSLCTTQERQRSLSNPNLAHTGTARKDNRLPPSGLRVQTRSTEAFVDLKASKAALVDRPATCTASIQYSGFNNGFSKSGITTKFSTQTQVSTRHTRSFSEDSFSETTSVRSSPAFESVPSTPFFGSESASSPSSSITPFHPLEENEQLEMINGVDGLRLNRASCSQEFKGGVVSEALGSAARSRAVFQTIECEEESDTEDEFSDSESERDLAEGDVGAQVSFSSVISPLFLPFFITSSFLFHFFSYSNVFVPSHTLVIFIP